MQAPARVRRSLLQRRPQGVVVVNVSCSHVCIQHTNKPACIRVTLLQRVCHCHSVRVGGPGHGFCHRVSLTHPGRRRWDTPRHRTATRACSGCGAEGPTDGPGWHMPAARVQALDCQLVEPKLSSDTGCGSAQWHTVWMSAVPVTAAPLAEPLAVGQWPIQWSSSWHHRPRATGNGEEGGGGPTESACQCALHGHPR